MKEGKEITANYDAICLLCNEPIKAGEKIYWYPGKDKSHRCEHIACREANNDSYDQENKKVIESYSNNEASLINENEINNEVLEKPTPRDRFRIEAGLGRDRYLFRPTSTDAGAVFETKEYQNNNRYIIVKWPKDKQHPNREIVFPESISIIKEEEGIVDTLAMWSKLSYLCRDVLAALTYIPGFSVNKIAAKKKQGKGKQGNEKPASTQYQNANLMKYEDPKNREIIVSLHQLCIAVGLPVNKHNYQQIKWALELLKVMRIKNYSSVEKREYTDVMRGQGSSILNFIDSVEALNRDENGDPIPKSQCRMRIVLSKLYITEMVLGLICVQVPPEPLRRVRSIREKEYAVAARNLAYAVASTRFKNDNGLKFETVYEIGNFPPTKYPAVAEKKVRALIAKMDSVGAISFKEKREGIFLIQLLK